MNDRGFSILILIGVATIVQPTWILYARAAFWRSRIMPRATRRKPLSSISPVTSLCVSKDDNNFSDNAKLNSQTVMPLTTSSSSFTTLTPPATIIDPDDCRTLLRTWANHSHSDYHNFTKEEAEGIRSALLEWYTNNRRKLPWRGDPPPFDGSTSGINSSTSKKRDRGNDRSKNNAMKKSKPDNRNQKSIKSFFSAKSTTDGTAGKGKATNKSCSLDTKTKKEPKEEVEEEKLGEAIAVTGYGVWVSEIMLQQTRVEAVIPFWIKWMKSFPTVYELAAATEDEVNAHWAGLGFYRRARYLHQGAKFVVQELDGNLPTTPEGLSKIAGIGPYTAAAIASIAFDVCVPVVDGNVCRVLSRLKGIANHIKHPALKDKLGWKLAAQIVEAGDGSSPGLVNQALMELGATYCAPAGSGVDDRDPLRDYYLSTQLGRAYLIVLQDCGSNIIDEISTRSCDVAQKEITRAGENTDIVLEKFRELISLNTTSIEAAKIGHSIFPMDPPKTDKREEDLAMAIILNRDEKSSNTDDSVRYLMVRRPKEGLLAGQWEFPNVCVQIRKKSNKKKAEKTASAKEPNRVDRDRALTKFLLQDLFLDYPNSEIVTALSNLSRKSEKIPLEHIFSHVKHYMWMEVGDLIHVTIGDNDIEWVSPSGREVRWMTKNDMKKVGITSGVKKVLQSVEKSLTNSSKLKTRRRQK